MVKVSIIMPCFNNGDNLGVAIESVLAQTFTDWEIIFINDGSTDNSLSIAQEYAKNDERIKIIDQSNSGVISARNKGIAMAKGEFILPLDSDDKISPDCVEKLYKIMQDNKTQKFAIAVPKFKYFGYEEFSTRMAKPTLVNIYNIRFWNVVTSMFRKKDFETIGGFDETFKNGAEDTDLWLSFMDHGGRMFVSDDILFYYRNYNPETAKNRNLDAHRLHRKKIMADLERKHPRIRWAKRIYSFTKMFFESNVARETVRVTRVFRIPFRTKSRD